MSANWVVAAQNFASSDAGQAAGGLLGMFGPITNSRLQRELGGINDEFTRMQNRIASAADANARVRATQGLISAQRAGLGASGVAGGRTSRLLEARARINASREQRQADQSRIFADTASRLNRIAGRAGPRRGVFVAANDLLASVASNVMSGMGSPGAAGG